MDICAPCFLSRSILHLFYGSLHPETSGQFHSSDQFNQMALFPFYCCIGGTWWHSQKFLQYIIVESTPFSILLYPLLSPTLE
jgi:hypothetical protein